MATLAVRMVVDVYVIECPHLSLDKIFASGQVYRWRRMGDGKYLVTDGHVSVKVTQMKNKLVFNCSDDEFYNKWFDYFDMGVDHEMLNYKISCCGDTMKVWAVRSQGVRIVRQDLFEVLLTSILSEMHTQYQTSMMVDKLCKLCGTKHVQSMAESGKVCWYEFPSPEQVLEKIQVVRDEVLDIPMGGSAPSRCRLANRLQDACRLYCEGAFGRDWLAHRSYSNNMEYLIGAGLSEWSANCVCLYSLHMMEAYPREPMVREALNKSFGDGDLVEVCDWYFPKLQPYKGLLYQYVMYNLLNPPVKFVYTGFGRSSTL